jgi:predicted xylose isomerase-like sugar epimerase
MALRLKFADLTEEYVAKVQKLEEEMGTIILALQAVHPFAALSDEAVSKVRELEHELGVVMLAYQPDVA